ncbi:helix-turn-helix domain-containing protein [Actinokineospora globicatena]|uniref:helix-turn-helix domain-containing protein n=1 Tax=Actinokineospora globicatena TaxID=103729 RepID=UPI0020A3A701|nr:helix-turn-helix transcriptional regulator [Actinokineospora globicatena]MCP2302748.1 Helix-turn-helix domain-containing protein [Actinokineospora globicatena]GLW75562.1 hypothetical protein Aglo01_00440 [Actinokineospora globicatena]GLW82402.1 hypothetical protein Aglo02_00430 [Actinokineospora globicatena]
MLSGNRKPASPKDRALGAELRKLRNAAGMSLAAVCEVLNWKESTLSRVERGQRSFSPETVMALALIYKIPHDLREKLIAWAKETPSLGWWDRQPAGIPTELGALAAYEQDVTRAVDWSPGIVPGLLQTPAYAEAVMREWGVPQDDIGARLRARRRRQDLLDRPNVEYVALLGTSALRNQLCDREEFVQQLQHIHRMSLRDSLTIRIVEKPTALAIGSWYLMYFDQAGPAVLIEHHESSTFLFDEETKAYVDARRRLSNGALSEQETRDRLEVEIDRVRTGG